GGHWADARLVAVHRRQVGKAIRDDDGPGQFHQLLGIDWFGAWFGHGKMLLLLSRKRQVFLQYSSPPANSTRRQALSDHGNISWNNSATQTAAISYTSLQRRCSPV